MTLRAALRGLALLAALAAWARPTFAQPAAPPPVVSQDGSGAPAPSADSHFRLRSDAAGALVLSGYAELGYTYNFARPSNGVNNFRAFNFRDETISLQRAVAAVDWARGPVFGRIALQNGLAGHSYCTLSEPAFAGASGAPSVSASVFEHIQEAYFGVKAGDAPKRRRLSRTGSRSTFNISAVSSAPSAQPRGVLGATCSMSSSRCTRAMRSNSRSTPTGASRAITVVVDLGGDLRASAPHAVAYAAARADEFSEHDAHNGDGIAAPIAFPVSRIASAVFTLDLRPADGLSVRCEYRHDASSRAAFFSGDITGDGSSARPFLANARVQDPLTLGATAWFQLTALASR